MFNCNYHHEVLMAKVKLVVSNIFWALFSNISLSYLTFLLNNERVLYLVLYYTQVYNDISLY
jgi:hypothetical protein